jgi:hypothetical protein
MRIPLLLSLAAVLIGGTAFGLENDLPPRDVRLIEKKFEALANRDADPIGAKALAIEPAKWKHAETDHFILHYRRATEAQKVVREIEFDLWFVARALGAQKDRYAKKSHVYVFEDEREWLGFIGQVDVPKWTASFAHGDELFLHVGGMGEGFDSDILGHETTHAVVSRIYPDRHWPRWLNEGFAEYMGTASQAARKKIWTKGMQKEIEVIPIPLAELVKMTEYPDNPEQVQRFYRTSEKVVRFLMNEYPKERFHLFAEALMAGTPLETALPQVYAGQVKNYADFLKQYARSK